MKPSTAIVERDQRRCWCGASPSIAEGNVLARAGTLVSACPGGCVGRAFHGFTPAHAMNCTVPSAFEVHLLDRERVGTATDVADQH